MIVKKILMSLILFSLVIPGTLAYTTDIYGELPDASGSATWVAGYTNIFDTFPGTDVEADQNDFAFANYSLPFVGRNITFNYDLTSDNQCSPGLKYYNYLGSAWVTSCTSCRTDTETDIAWDIAIGNTGKLRLYTYETASCTPGEKYAELFLDSFTVNGFETEDNVLNIYIYDETSPSSLITNFDLSIYNSTTSDNYDGVNIFTVDKTTIATEDITITVGSSNHGTRTFYETLSGSNYTNYTYYLVPTGSGNSINFVIVDLIAQPIIGANVQAIRTIDGTPVIIEEKTTDASGNVNMFLDQTASYIIALTATGYTSVNYTLTPANPPYTLRMLTTDYEEIDWLFDRVYEDFDPDFLVDGNNTLSYNLFDWNNTLEYWEYNVSYNGTTLSSTYNDTLPGGGTMTVIVDMTGYSGNITATGRFKVTGHSEHLSTVTYVFWDYNGSYYQSNYTLNETLSIISEAEELKSNPTVQLGVGLIIIMLSLGAGAVANKFDPSGNGSSAPMAMLVVLSLLSIIMGSIFSWGFYILTVVAVLMMLLLKSNF